MIEGVIIKKISKIPDERGMVMHMLRCDSKNFTKFGEIYFSTIYPQVIKGWHFHNKMTLNYAVVKGMIKLVLYDAREKSVTYGELMELFIGDLNYCLVTIPPGIWNGFKCISLNEAIVANCSDLPYEEKEIKRIDPIKNDVINYDWSVNLK
jgi:dTDP-4-dehydrorhamnose 3,5-epimerase